MNNNCCPERDLNPHNPRSDTGEATAPATTLLSVQTIMLCVDVTNLYSIYISIIVILTLKITN